MSLLRLLAAGKSLVGLRDSAGRYRDLGPEALPKFGDKKKLFRSSRRRAAAVAEGAAPPATSSEPRSADMKPAPSPAATPVQQPKTWRAIWQALWRRKTASGIPRFDKAPVQTELSLDRVKVVRNDLSDSDLEVVPARAAVSGPGGASVPSETRGPAAESPASAAKQADLLIRK